MYLIHDIQINRKDITNLKRKSLPINLADGKLHVVILHVATADFNTWLEKERMCKTSLI